MTSQVATGSGIEKTGQCLCGSVKFSCKPQTHDDQKLHVDACHCGMCARLVSGAFMGITLQEPPVVEDGSSLAVYSSSDWAERLFCKTCGANLFYRMKNGGLQTVAAGTLNDLDGAALTLEIFTDEKPAYYDFAQSTKKMTGAEVMAVFANDGSAS